MALYASLIPFVKSLWEGSHLKWDSFIVYVLKSKLSLAEIDEVMKTAFHKASSDP